MNPCMKKEHAAFVWTHVNVLLSGIPPLMLARHVTLTALLHLKCVQPRRRRSSGGWLRSGGVREIQSREL